MMFLLYLYLKSLFFIKITKKPIKHPYTIIIVYFYYYEYPIALLPSLIYSIISTSSTSISYTTNKLSKEKYNHNIFPLLSTSSIFISI